MSSLWCFAENKWCSSTYALNSSQKAMKLISRLVNLSMPSLLAMICLYLALFNPHSLIHFTIPVYQEEVKRNIIWIAKRKRLTEVVNYSSAIVVIAEIPVYYWTFLTTNHQLFFLNGNYLQYNGNKKNFPSISVQFLIIAVHPPRPPADLFPLIHG